MIRNPYDGVDWHGTPVPSNTHVHGRTKARMDDLYDVGFRHLALSDYYPSDPSLTYPLTNLEGVGPGDVPADLIGCPNAEHHEFTDCTGHVGAIGSMLATGDADSGYQGPWRDFVDEAVAEMLYPNGGGICLNHPRLAYMGDSVAMEWLDYSEHVLGIEVYNHLGEWNYSGRGWALANWHRILVTGRRCYGFAATDHWVKESSPTPLGSNMLLVPATYAAMNRAEREQACAEAYFRGQWYMALAFTSPALRSMTADATEVAVEFDRPCSISFHYGLPGEAVERSTSPVVGTSASYALTGSEVYVRAEATDGADERALTQPVMLLDMHEVDALARERRMRRFVVLGV